MQKIKNNVYVIFTLIFIITLGVIIFIVQSQTNDIVSELTLKRAQAAKQDLISYLKELEARAMQRAELIASRENFRNGVLSKDYEAIKRILLDYSAGIDMLSVCDSEGKMLVRSYNDSHGDDVSKEYNIATVLKTGKRLNSIVILSREPLTICASAPVYNEGRLIGVINCNFDLTKNEYLDKFKERTGCEAAIFVGSERVAATDWDQDKRLMSTKANDLITEAILAQKEEYYLGFMEILDNMYGVHYSPLNSGGQVIGMIFAGVNVDTILDRQRVMNYWIFLASLLGVIAAVGFGVVSNIYARKYALAVKELTEKTLEMDEYSQILLDAMPMSCTLWNNNLKIVNCNQETMKLFGVKNIEEYNDRFNEISPLYQPCGEKSDELSSALLKKAFDEGFYRCEWMHKSLGGGDLPCDVTLVRVKHRDGFLVAGYVRDLREHKAYVAKINKVQERLRHARDSAEAANKSKSVFLAHMSHEIRTPLNSIIGFSELAEDSEIPVKTKDYLDKITENAKWLLCIINDILDISKIESGKMHLEHIPFSLHDIFALCQASMTRKAAEKGIPLYCNAEPLIGKMLLGDPVRLRQVLINLLSNAIKFTHTGSIKLRAYVELLSENRAKIYFEVEDTGIGMAPEQVERVFLPFMQADDSISRKYGGTGLGIPITKSIIEIMGGRLEVVSTQEVGSTFSFELAFDVIDELTDSKTHRIVLSELEKPNFEGEVLICEDNEMNQQVICEHLSRVGLKTVVANHGREGLDIVLKRGQSDEKPFDLIFMDIHMPVMDGLEAASKITAYGIKTPIVAMTANIMSNEIELYKANGMPDYVSKPFTSQELWKCLLKYFRRVGVSVVDERRQTADNNKMLMQLKGIFVRNNKTICEEIKKALNDENIKLAHRLVHTLKGNAGQIGEEQLQKAAANVEEMLKGGKNKVTEEQIERLEEEMKLVLDKLASLSVE